MIKFNHIFILVGLLTISLGACHKHKKEPYVLTGKLVTDCSGTPYANKELKLYQQISGGGIFSVKGGTLVYASTDANGYFRFEYFPENNQPLWISSLVKGIPVGDLDVGTINVAPRGNFRIFLEPGDSAYTEQDTLFYTNFVYPGNPFPINSYRYAVGPFEQEVIDSVIGVQVLGASIYNSPTRSMAIECFLNKNPDSITRYEFEPGLCGEWGGVTLKLP